jgi:phosphatidylinositol alpha-mannosyltransferase
MRKPLRIGLVCPYSLTIPGGVQAQVLGLARALRGLGHDARVLGPCDGPPPDAGVTPLGVSVPTAANGSVAPLAPDPAAQLRTIRALRDEGFDVVHLHEPLCPGPTQTVLLFRNAPLLGTFHAAGESASYRYLRPPLRWLAGRLDRRAAVSKAAIELASRYFPGDYELLFNAVEIDLWAKAEPWPRDERPTVLFVGRHEPRKGLDVLLASLPALPADARVWVVGDGPDTAQLQARHAGDDRIEWLGRVEDDEKRRRMVAADVFCTPALRGESFGIVLLEAMAAGTPVVASDIDGYRNVATDGVDARLVAPGEPEVLGAALAAVLSDGRLAAALVDGGQARAESFSMQHLAERYLALYDDIR